MYICISEDKASTCVYRDTVLTTLFIRATLYCVNFCKCLQFLKDTTRKPWISNE